MSIPIRLQSLYKLLLTNTPHHRIQAQLGLENQTYLNYRSELIKAILKELELPSREHAIALLYEAAALPLAEVESVIHTTDPHVTALENFLAATDATHHEIASINQSLNSHIARKAVAK